MLLGGARSGGSVQTLRAPPQRIAPPTQQQPALRFGRPTASGQATRTNSTITSEQLGTGSKAARSIRPPGWQEQVPDDRRPDQERGHLLAKVLGGPGKDPRNFVTIPKKTNQAMWSFEKMVRDRANSGEVVEYQVQPFYDGAGQPPSTILMTATGTRGQPMGRIIFVGKPKP
ncbi:DNA/RNA non-specific endonuclease [Phenylobacterium sp.]|uniref:DNA/RNA non-specific endonuclease n=1 Tax=Phenylobacterium sp. TaxID=1871053 RepID=UPI00352187E2